MSFINVTEQTLSMGEREYEITDGCDGLNFLLKSKKWKGEKKLEHSADSITDFLRFIFENYNKNSYYKFSISFANLKEKEVKKNFTCIFSLEVGAQKEDFDNFLKFLSNLMKGYEIKLKKVKWQQNKWYGFNNWIDIAEFSIEVIRS